MGFVKVVKNKAYFKRFQTKYRRRREGKTDYGARRNMVKVEKNKYATAKYRLVARFTNRRVIAQIAWATIEGDKILMHADSTELKGFGVEVGLKNYAAAYCTGLLLARRVLEKVGLADSFKGVEEVNGEEFHVEDDYDGDRRPFKAVLDVGLKRTTIGSRVFGVLKGAADGGLHIPHSTKRFPGYKPGDEKGQGEYDAEFHKERIFGGHVSEYMESMKEEDAQQYEKMYSGYIAAEVEPDDMEEMYQKAHEKIRGGATKAKKVQDIPKPVRNGNQVTSHGGSKTLGKTWTRKVRLNHKDRKARVAQKIANAQRKMMED
jgi:large subunit ribosomal protein L5e